MGVFGYGLTENDGASGFIGDILDDALIKIKKQIKKTQKHIWSEDGEFFGAMYMLLKFPKIMPGFIQLDWNISNEEIDAAIGLAAQYASNKDYLNDYRDPRRMKGTCSKLHKDLIELKKQIS